MTSHGSISLEICVFYWTKHKKLHKNSYHFSDFDYFVQFSRNGAKHFGRVGLGQPA